MQIGLALWTQAFIPDRLRELTLFTLRVNVAPRERCLILQGVDLISLIEQARERGDHYLFVVSAGNYLRGDCVEQLRRQIEDWREPALIGHFLDRSTRPQFMELHYQSFALNLRKLQNLSLEDFTPTSHVRSWPAVESSFEHHHEAYTPVWIQANEAKHSPSMRGAFGSGVIAKALALGETLPSFNSELRARKIFAYPEDNEHWPQTAELMAKDFPLEEIAQVDSIAHRHFLQVCAQQFHGFDQDWYTFNTEDYEPAKDFRTLKTLYLLPSGLKPLFLLQQLSQQNAIEKIVFYDVSQRALTYYQELLAELDPKRPLAFFEKDERLRQGLQAHEELDEPSREKIRKLWQAELSRWPCSEDLFEIVRDLRQGRFQVEFRQINLLENFESLLAEVQPGEAFVWYSNIFNYIPAHFRYGDGYLQRREKEWLEFVREKKVHIE